MAKRTRRPTVAWLPCFPAPVIGNSPNSNFSEFVLDINQFNADGTTGISFLTVDAPAESRGSAARGIADFEGGGYRLRRIVGKCWVAMRPDATAGSPDGCIVTAGFIVLRVNSDTGIPLAADFNDYSPQLFGSDRDPWIWRRSWKLSNRLATSAGTQEAKEYPFTNAEYGSVADGPHIDQKTARTVKTEERLVFVAAAIPVGTNFGVPANGRVAVTLDYRLLASPMKIMGNRGNASR